MCVAKLIFRLFFDVDRDRLQGFGCYRRSDDSNTDCLAKGINMQRGVWFPTVRAHTGTDVFTEQLATGLEKIGYKVAIDWLPLRAEYAPWSVRAPSAPEWADIAHVNSWLATRFIPARMKVVTTIHHSIHDPRLQPFKGELRRWYHRHWIQWLERRNLARADSVIAVSKDAALWATEILGATNVQVIHNGIDLSGMPLLENRVPNSPFRLIYLGTWMTRKGVDLLPEIMHRLGKNYELLCIGGEPAKAARGKLPENIRLIGKITDRKELLGQLNKADAFLFPSRSEGLSLALIEAQSAGLPVIAANCSSIPEVVIDGVTGILCPVDDVQKFVEAAQTLADSREIWMDMRIAAGKLAASRFGHDAQIDAYASVYAGLMKTINSDCLTEVDT